MLATTGTMRVVLRRNAVNQSPQETPERALVPKPPLVARTAGCSVPVCSAGVRRSSARAGAGRGACSSSTHTPAATSIAPRPVRPAARPAPRLAARAAAAATGGGALPPAPPWQHARARRGGCKTSPPRAPRRRTRCTTAAGMRAPWPCGDVAGNGAAARASTREGAGRTERRTRGLGRAVGGGPASCVSPCVVTPASAVTGTIARKYLK